MNVVHIHHEAWWAVALSAIIVVGLAVLTLLPAVAAMRAGHRAWPWWLAAVLLGPLNALLWVLRPRRSAH